MRPENTMITKLVDKLYAMMGRHDRGDIVPHESFDKILRIPRHKGHWQTCVKKLKDRMEAEREITVVSEHGKGYRLCPVIEQITVVPMKGVARAKGWISRSSRSVGCLQKEPMTTHQQRVRNGQMTALENARKAMDQQARIQSVLAKEIEPRPYRQAPEARP